MTASANKARAKANRARRELAALKQAPLPVAVQQKRATEKAESLAHSNRHADAERIKRHQREMAGEQQAPSSPRRSVKIPMPSAVEALAVLSAVAASRGKQPAA